MTDRADSEWAELEAPSDMDVASFDDASMLLDEESAFRLRMDAPQPLASREPRRNGPAAARVIEAIAGSPRTLRGAPLVGELKRPGARKIRERQSPNRAKVVVVMPGSQWPGQLARELAGGLDTLVLACRVDETLDALAERLSERMQRSGRSITEVIWVSRYAQRHLAIKAAGTVASRLRLRGVRLMLSEAGAGEPAIEVPVGNVGGPARSDAVRAEAAVASSQGSEAPASRDSGFAPRVRIGCGWRETG